MSDDYTSTTSTTGSLALGVYSTGSIETAGDTDWFRIYLIAGQRVSFNLEGSPTSHGSLSDTYLRGIYDSVGTAIVGTTDDDGGVGYNSAITFTTTAAGYYYVSAGAYGSNLGTYGLLATSPDDYAASTSTTGVLAFNSYSTGYVEASGDQDWFRISLAAGQSVRFDLEGSPTSRGTLPDTYLIIYDSSGTFTGILDDDSGVGFNSSLTFTASTAGTYYVSAGAYGTTNAGSYSLLATSVDDYAATTSTTGLLTLGGAYSTGNIESNGDTDWFRISLTAGQRVDFDLEGSPTARGTLPDTYLRGIYDSTGTLIVGTSDDDAGVGYNSAVTFTATTTGDYYVSAGAYWTNTGTYSLRASTADDFSNTTSTTGLLDLGGVYSTGNIENAGDSDWFRISLTAGQNIRFDLEGTNTARGTLIDPFLTGIYNSSGTLIPGTSNDDNGVNNNSTVNFTVTTTGDYYVAAGGFSAGTGTYSLRATQADDYASTTSTTGNLVFNGAYSTGNIESIGDTDWFRISLAAGQQVLLNLEGSPTGRGTLADTYIYGIYNSAGVGVAGGNDDNGTNLNSTVAFTATTAGNYYVSAGAFGSNTGTYSLRATDLVDDFAANTSTTGHLAFNAYSTGEIERSGDVDWFHISLTAGQSVHFDLEGSPTSRGTLADTYLRGIYDSSGVLIAGTSDDDSGDGFNSAVNFTATTTGDYYVAAGAYSSGTGTYSLRASEIDDFASTTATTGSLTPNVYSTGDIETAGDTDWFRISLTAGQQVRFDLEGSPTGKGTLTDTYIRGIYDSSGTLIANTSNDDNGTNYNSLVNFTATATGTYYVAAGAYGSNVGSYSLRATPVTPPPPTDDFSSNVATTGNLALNTYSTGNIETGGDTDWFRITLAAGQQVHIDLEGSPTARGTLTDTYIRGVYNSSGALIPNTSDDDSGTGFNSALNFTATTAGTYYIAAGGYGGRTGTYSLKATPVTVAAPAGAFNIEFNFDASVTAQVRSFFETAAARWESIITADIPSYNGVDDLRIDVSTPFIDGVYNILGQAGPTVIRPIAISPTRLPSNGQMEFDSADVNYMISTGIFGGVILHEMGHVLGIGTLWGTNSLTSGSNYVGAHGLQEYRTLAGNPGATGVPLETGGGPGTAGAHWAENVFRTELMTGYVDTSMQLSRLTIGAIHDLGYTVDYSKADAYSLPGASLVSKIVSPPPTPPSITFGTHTATAGNDTLIGTTGNDVINGLAGNDTINGLTGNDKLDGGLGNDTLTGGAGNDELEGGLGVDTAGYTFATAAVTVNLGLVAFQSTGGAGSDKLTNIESLLGSRNFNDTLIGNGLNNVLSGDGGNDILSSGAGNDTLIGGAGNDILVGGLGKDILTGGAGADRFDFNLVTETGITNLTRDLITDFKISENDRINLSGIDANVALAGNQAFTFIGTAAFSANATGQLRFAGGILYGSDDVDIAPEFSIQLTGVASLTSTAFIL